MFYQSSRKSENTFVKVIKMAHKLNWDTKELAGCCDTAKKSFKNCKGLIKVYNDICLNFKKCSMVCVYTILNFKLPNKLTDNNSQYSNFSSNGIFCKYI